MDERDEIESERYRQRQFDAEFWRVVDAEPSPEDEAAVPLSTEMRNFTTKVRRETMLQRMRNIRYAVRHPYGGVLADMLRESRSARIMCVCLALGATGTVFMVMNAVSTNELQSGSDGVEQDTASTPYVPMLTDEMVLEREAAFSGDSPKHLYERTYTRTFTDESGPSFRYGQTCLSETPYDTSKQMAGDAAGVVYDFENNRVRIVPKNGRLPELQFIHADDTSRLVEPYDSTTRAQLEAYGCDDPQR